jgi:hypothetical protein
VVDILDRAAAGEIVLIDADLRGVERALSLSDDNAMSALWSRFGGAATVDGAVAAAGLQDSRRPSHPSQWGRRGCRRATSWRSTTWFGPTFYLHSAGTPGPTSATSCRSTARAARPR